MAAPSGEKKKQFILPGGNEKDFSLNSSAVCTVRQVILARREGTHKLYIQRLLLRSNGPGNYSYCCEECILNKSILGFDLYRSMTPRTYLLLNRLRLE